MVEEVEICFEEIYFVRVKMRVVWVVFLFIMRILFLFKCR